MTEHQITKDEHEFRLQVVESLTRLETLAESTEGHLRDLNGTVARHEGHINDLLAAAKADQAKGAMLTVWAHRLAPLLWLCIGGVLVLFLTHGEQLLRALSKH